MLTSDLGLRKRASVSTSSNGALCSCNIIILLFVHAAAALTARYALAGRPRSAAACVPLDPHVI